MTNQEKKEYLGEYRQMGERIDQITEHLERLYALLMKRTPTLSDMPKAKTDEDRMAKTIERVIELNALLNQEIDAYVEKRQEITQAIRTVEDLTLQTLLEYRYLNGKTWEEIAERMNYGHTQIHRLHNKAISLMMG